MYITLNPANLYEEAESLWKNNPEIAEALMKCLEIAHQEKITITRSRKK